MIIMVNRYSPSINIKRDIENDFLYIPTRNSIEAFNTIANNFKSGFHSYNIIGSYGTGKSAFLLAFYKHLLKDQKYFPPVNGQFNGCSKFKFIQIVGNYESLITSLARELDVEENETIVYEAIKELQNKGKKKNECLILIVDEFGKSLEYAAKNSPELELYFIQRIAEYANDSKRNFLFLTTLHQNFDAYAIGLNEKDRKEWEKVKGRIKELPFNEPVEQMLDLAGQAISNQLRVSSKTSLSKKLLSIIKKSNLFRLRNELNVESSQRLFPLEPLSASCLLIALQKYGQNERSLFNFISANEPLGIQQHLSEKKDIFYGLPMVYNYLLFNYSYLLQSKNNPDFFKWRIVITALDRVDASINSDQELCKKIIKTIGLLSLVNSQGVKISLEFLKQYFKEVLNKSKIENAVDELIRKKIIKFHKYKDSYSVYEGTDIDIEFEIAKKKEAVGRLQFIKNHIPKYLNLDYIVAKSITYKKGTPRIFKYEITEAPKLNLENQQSEIDGIINIVLEKDSTAGIKHLKSKDAIAYCFVNLTEKILDQLNDIHIIDRILIEEELDKVAKQELVEFKDSLIKSFVNYFKQSLFSDKSNWIINGKQVKILNERELNRMLSNLIQKVYPDTPQFRNELINKSRLSGTIQYAKKSFISALLNNYDKPQLGFEGTKFPPERTIYHSLLEDTGIHISNPKNQIASFSTPSDKTFQKLWNVSEKFLESSKKGKRSIEELIGILQKPPFKLKDGFIEFWLITFLFIRREDYALYMDGRYLPNFTPEVGDLLFKKSKIFSIKGIEVDGIRLSLFNKYRSIIKQGSSSSIKNKGFQEIAKPFLIFYKHLSPFSKKTTKHLSEETIRFRNTLLNAKELEKTFFEDLPKCFGYSIDQLEKNKLSLDAFASSIQNSIRELRLQDERLTDRIFEAISNHIGLMDSTFEVLRNKMQERYNNNIEHLLNASQKSLFRRIHSQIPEKSLWISSISQILVGKPLTKISDAEELILLDQVKKHFSNLDALLEISSLHYDIKNEVALRYEIQGSDKLRKNNQIVLNKKEIREINKLKKDINVILKNHEVKVQEGLLLQLLKDLGK